MDEIKAQLPPIYRRIIESAERKFPEASERHCPEKEEGFCGITEERCSLRGCPKIQGTRKTPSETG